MKPRIVPMDIATWTDSVPLKDVLLMVVSEFDVCMATAHRWWKRGLIPVEVKWRSVTRVEVFEASVAPAFEKLRAWVKGRK